MECKDGTRDGISQNNEPGDLVVLHRKVYVTNGFNIWSKFHMEKALHIIKMYYL